MADIFISYSRKDGEFVRYLHAKLQEEKRDIWVDWEDIPPTADWWDEIKAAIESSDAFAFVISPNSVRSEVCRSEIQHAIDNNKHFVPILFQEVGDEDGEKMHPAIRSHNWIPYTDTNGYEDAFKKLIQAISTQPQYLRQHTRLLVRAKEWANSDRNPSYLLKGVELREFQQWLLSSQSLEPKPTEQQLEFILASQNASARNQLRLFFGAISALLVFAVMIGFLIFQNGQIAQNNLQNTADAQNLALTSQAQETRIAEQLTSIANSRDDSQNLIVQVNLQNTLNAVSTENANLRSTLSAIEVAIVTSPTADSEAGLSPENEVTETNIISATSLPTSTADAVAQGLPTEASIMPTSNGAPTNNATSEENVERPDYFVNAVGNDTNDCISPQTGCATINAALAKASENDVIEIAQGVYFETLLIDKSITLVGLDRNNTLISNQLSGANITIITVEEGVSLHLQDLTVTGGEADYGGGILNWGNLSLDNVRVIGNSAHLVGGGIANFGSLEGERVEFGANSAFRFQDLYTSPESETLLDGEETPVIHDGGGLGENLLVEVNTTEGDRLNLRNEPSTNTRGSIPLSDGTAILIIGDSQQRENFTWWHVLIPTGEIGWVVESVDNIQTLIPIE